VTNSPSLVRTRSFSGVFTSSSVASPRHHRFAGWVAVLLAIGLVSCTYTLSRLRAEVAASGQEHADLQRDTLRRMDAIVVELAVLRKEFRQSVAQSTAETSGARTAIDGVAATLGEHSISITTKLERLATTTTAIPDQLSRLGHVASSSAVDSLAEQLSNIESKMIQPAPPASPLLPMTAATAQPPAAQKHTEHIPPPAPPPRPAARTPNRFVELKFEFDSTGLDSKSATLYWLRRGMYEHAYAEIAAGGHAFERTYPGECWRVCDSVTGDQLITRYCATSEPQQVVRISGTHSEVTLEFAYPDAHHDRLSADSIEIIETSPGRPRSSVGHVSRGHFFTAPTFVGATFDVLEMRTARVLKKVTASAAAFQYHTIGADSVRLEFVTPRHAMSTLTLSRVRADGEEHLVQLLEPGEAARVVGWAGEVWNVREKSRDAVVMSVTASAEPSQRIYVAAQE